ncbi:hypothetical protein F5Y03DRAFT_214714 [Xylaria venustula]|nr:hypothetical protein F5Y03DRAFT_214714 [Xylaria venustula]
MDIESAAQRRVELRAVGRTLEEHAALEQALARRRARPTHASPVFHPDQQHYFSQLQNENPGYPRSHPPSAGDSQRSVDHREASPAEEPEYLHDVDDSEIYRTFRIRNGLETPRMKSMLFPYFDYAMFRAKVAAAKSGPSLPAMGVPPGRKSRPKYSQRNVRGAGWHRRGYRSYGDMWINVRAGSHGFTRGMDVSENSTLSEFVRHVFSSWQSRYPEGWYCDLFFRKKSVTRLLVDLENYGLDMELVLVKDYFDGGETVYFKLFDQDGEQRDQTEY